MFIITLQALQSKLNKFVHDGFNRLPAPKSVSIHKHRSSFCSVSLLLANSEQVVTRLFPPSYRGGADTGAGPVLFCAVRCLCNRQTDRNVLPSFSKCWCVFMNGTFILSYTINLKSEMKCHPYCQVKSRAHYLGLWTLSCLNCWLFRLREPLLVSSPLANVVSSVHSG